MKERIESVLNELRPLFRADGTDVELLDVSEDGVVRIRLNGVCGTCGGSIMTLKQGVERLVMEQVPGVKEVVLI
jgi:Fe-S cluster biogenesis protein NfuA